MCTCGRYYVFEWAGIFMAKDGSVHFSGGYNCRKAKPLWKRATRRIVAWFTTLGQR